MSLVDKVIAGAAIAFGVIGLIGMFGVESLRGGYVGMALEHKPQMPGEAARAAFTAFAGDLGKVSFLGLALVLMAWFARRGKFPVALASVVALTLLLVELWPVSRAVMQPTIGDPVTRNLEAGRDDVIDWLAKAGPAGSFRVFYPEQEWFMDNRAASFGISSHTCNPGSELAIYRTGHRGDAPRAHRRVAGVAANITMPIHAESIGSR